MELTAYELHMLALVWNKFVEDPPKGFQNPEPQQLAKRQNLADKLNDFNVYVCIPLHNPDAVVLVQAAHLAQGGEKQGEDDNR